jgi:serine/threonine-protein kinase
MSSERDSQKSQRSRAISPRLRNQVIEGFDRLLADQPVPGTNEPQSSSGISPEIHRRLLDELHLTELSSAAFDPASNALWHDSLGADRFEIIRPIASGGMGLVSEAIDREFDRPVALKEILPAGANDPAYRLRFQTEAEITARLDHPGIIPVYGRGRLPDGRLYYTMRLISGEHAGTLQKAIREFHHTPGSGPAIPLASERDLAWRSLLRRVIDVCNTMAYAHRQGVLHRDLKPSNILLGPCGETLVVDWGLARFVHATSEQQLSGLQAGSTDSLTTQVTWGIGTLAHAAPEQLVGDGLVANRSTDIYALGTILYAVLTGRSPFATIGSEDTADLSARIRSGSCPTPTQANPQVDPALEAICLKAMAREPAQRYADVGDLADDLERALAGEPVSAWKESWSRTARRWVSRHRTLVWTAALGLLMSTAALGGLSIVQSWNRAELQKQALQLEQQAQALAEALRESRAAAERVAAAQQRTEQLRVKAIDNARLAIAAVTRFHQTVAASEELNSQPRLAPLREQLLRDPLPFFEELRQRLMAEEEPSLESLAQLREATILLAQVHREVGDTGEALRLGRDTIELCQSVLESAATSNLPTRRDWQLALARSHFALGNLLPQGEHKSERLQTIRKAIVEFEAALPLFSEDTTGILVDLSTAHSRVALIQADLGLLPEARESLEKAQPLHRELSARSADNSQLRTVLAGNHERFSVIFDLLDDPAAAAEQSQLADEIYRELGENHPEDQKVVSRRAISHLNRGVALLRREQHQRAVKQLQISEQFWRQLCQQSPGQNEFEDGLRFAQRSLAQSLEHLGRQSEAIAVLQNAISGLRSTMQKSPTVENFQGILVEMLHRLGHLLEQTNRGAEARQTYSEALEQVGVLLQTQPQQVQWRLQAVDLHIHLGQFEISENALVLARDRLAQFRELARELATATQSSSEARQLYRHLLTILLTVYERLGADVEAAQCVVHLRDSAAQEPQLQPLLDRLRQAREGVDPASPAECLKLGALAMDHRETEIAERLFRRVLEQQPELAADREKMIPYHAARAALSEAFRHQAADADRAATLRQRALKWLRDDLRAWQELAIQNPLVVAQNLRMWRLEPIFIRVWDPAFRDTLPPDELADWQDLIRDLEQALATAP